MVDEMNECVICGQQILDECGSMVCEACLKKAQATPIMLAEVIKPKEPNVELSFGADNGEYDFLVCYRRAKPLNWFQRWMFKVCFGINAKNV